MVTGEGAAGACGDGVANAGADANAETAGVGVGVGVVLAIVATMSLFAGGEARSAAGVGRAGLTASGGTDVAGGAGGAGGAGVERGCGAGAGWWSASLAGLIGRGDCTDGTDGTGRTGFAGGVAVNTCCADAAAGVVSPCNRTITTAADFTGRRRSAVACSKARPMPRCARATASSQLCRRGGLGRSPRRCGSSAAASPGAAPLALRRLAAGRAGGLAVGRYGAGRAVTGPASGSSRAC